MKARLRSFSKFYVTIIFTISILSRIILQHSVPLTYDEIAYSMCAQNIAVNGGWLNIYNSGDLFFFPPLFNWLGALFIMMGFEQVLAVRTVTILVSSGIPVMIYLLMVKSGQASRIALFTAIIWIVLPGSIIYSIAGQAETPFLFFVLMSAYFFSMESDKLKNILLSAFFLSVSVWFKETAIGFIPVFLFLFVEKKEFKYGAIWLTILVVFLSPLIAQTFIPHKYDLFFELSNDLIKWNDVSVYYPFFYMAALAGFNSATPIFSLISAIISALIVIVFSVIAFVKFRQQFIVRFSLISNAIFIPFFIVFPKKFEYYMLPVMIFSLIILCSVIPRNSVFRISFAAVFVALSVSGLFYRANAWNYYNDINLLLKKAESISPGSTVGTPTPHIAIYAVSSSGFNLKIKPLDFFTGEDSENCRNKNDRCILKQDFFLADDQFFTVLFCKNWPVQTENCDLEAMKTVIQKMEKIEKRSGFTLYKVLEKSR